MSGARRPARVVAVGAHPDDVEIGCAGALLRAAADGAQVTIVDLTRGERATHGTVTMRNAEADAAANALGAARRNVELPDAALENVAAQRAPLAALLRELAPDMLLAPYWHDRHPDHRAAAALTRDACFVAGLRAPDGAGHKIRHLYHYPIHDSETPDIVLDISDQWPAKRRAIETHLSQFPGGFESTDRAPGSTLLRAVEARAVVLGAMVGAAYGEGFFCRGPVALSALPFAADMDGYRAL